MKKSLIALAALAAVTAASAQSTVTLSGAYTFSYQKDLTNVTANSVYAPTTATAATNTDAAVAKVGKGFAVTDAFLKLSAVEDLGGGLKAAFDYTLETGAQRGAAATRADSGISVSGGFGTIAARNTRGSDLISTIGSTAISLPDGIYDSSSIVSRPIIDTVGYTSNEITPGLRFSATYIEIGDGAVSPGTAASPSNTASSNYVLGAAYAVGPLSLSAAYKSKPKNSVAASGVTSKANMELAAVYDLGVAKVAYAYDGAQAEGTGSTAAAAATTKAANGFSVSVPVGSVTLGLNYFKRAEFKQTEVGASYALSKRTTLGAAIGKQTADANGNQSRVRLIHTF